VGHGLRRRLHSGQTGRLLSSDSQSAHHPQSKTSHCSLQSNIAGCIAHQPATMYLLLMLLCMPHAGHTLHLCYSVCHAPSLIRHLCMQMRTQLQA
jgi:hypothetical protein